LKLNQYLGYDFNTVEFAVRDGVPYAIDFCNPAPDAEVTSVGQENFDWVVETSAKYAIERAKEQVDGKDNLTWGEYVKASAAGTALPAGKNKVAGKTPAKGDPSKATAPKAKKSVKADAVSLLSAENAPAVPPSKTKKAPAKK
jgi:hypothetical protein